MGHLASNRIHYWSLNQVNSMSTLHAYHACLLFISVYWKPAGHSHHCQHKIRLTIAHRMCTSSKLHVWPSTMPTMLNTWSKHCLPSSALLTGFGTPEQAAALQ